MALKKWIIAQGDKQRSRELAAEYNIPPYAAHLLVTRGYTDPESIRRMLSPCDIPFRDPFTIKDMDKAVERINRAIDNFECIMVYGDYDVDGVTATSLLYSYLARREANVYYMLPSRDDGGYGLHMHTVDRMHEMGTKLIVTVDNGISAKDEIAYAMSLGMDVVVTDHHQPPDELPDACAIVNPHRPGCPSQFKYYAGVGVAFKLVCALEGDAEKMAEEYCDLVALGTVADIVPLQDENRSLVVRGLKLINEQKRHGISSLLATAGTKGTPTTANDIAYTLSPRINSAGRLGKPDRAVELMLCPERLICNALAGELNDENNRRHECERQIAEQAWNMLQDNPELMLDRVVVVGGSGWNVGVIGIFAAKLCESLGKPCIVLSSDGEITKGSGRSLGDFSLYDMLTSVSDMLIAYGGHTLAAGLTMNTADIDEFRRRINEFAANQVMPVPELGLDCELPLSMINSELVDAADVIEPFGASNPSPLIAVRNVRIEKVTPVGGGFHQRLQISGAGVVRTAMCFGYATAQFAFRPGDIVDIAASVSRSDFRGDNGVTIIVRDIRISSIDVEGIIAADRLVEQLLRGEPVTRKQAELCLPQRSDYETIYRFFAHIGFRGTYDVLGERLRERGVAYEKMRVALCSMEQLGLVDVKTRAGITTIKVNQVSFKADLETSPIITLLLSCLPSDE